ncbi:SDR family oxidoreductase [Chitinophaga horti]|uniref:dTDP-4-dehydrorhamnose reductase n=1 Tax=Chitinophaga horti TaxID=2920382 RepID=A0ABY6IVC4_9BACT|nr:SDR family oxidoreductase [Chitinophaga horti]UYQ91320.1 SDR family oxidoreductase [Chitinophaga horti]
MKTILITGSNGLLGQYLVQLFSEDAAWQVVATGKGPNRLRRQSGYTYEAADLTDQEAIASLIAKHQPQVIIHSGAMTQADDCERNKDACRDTNVTATKYLLEASVAFFLFLSTDFVFDGLNGPYREDDLVNPISFYGSSKVLAERAVMAARQPWAIARTVLVYGVSDDPKRSNIITWVKGNLEQGKSIKVVDDQWRTPTLVQDLAIGCKLIVEQQATGIYHLSGKDLMTPYDMALAVAEHFSLDASLMERVNADTFTQPAKRPARTGFVIDKAVKDLGFAPRSFKEGIEIVKRQLT